MVTFRYELTGRGWADCTLQIGDRSVTASASYLSNALDDFARAVVAILNGDASASAEFTEEPGHFTWQFDRTDGDDLRVRLFWSLPRWNDEAHDPGTPLFDETCRLRTFAAQLLSELQRLQSQHGPAGYKDLWVLHEFPTRRLTQLESLLRTTP